MVQKKIGQFGPRFFIYLLGLFLMAVGVVLLLQADLGVPPWDVLHVGLFLNFGLTIGTWNIIVGIVILTLSALISKEFPQFGAFLNMLLIGTFIDFLLWTTWIQTPLHLIGQMMMLTAGTLVIGYGMGLYISASFGAGPRDSLMIALTNATRWKISHVRALIEIVVLIIGWLLGGPVFIGTILFTVLIGPISGIVIPQCEKLTQAILLFLRNRQVASDGSQK